MNSTVVWFVLTQHWFFDLLCLANSESFPFWIKRDQEQARLGTPWYDQECWCQTGGHWEGETSQDLEAAWPRIPRGARPGYLDQRSSLGSEDVFQESKGRIKEIEDGCSLKEVWGR